jgi:outer membrane usher protein
VPFDRSGVSVAFDVRRGEAATATLRDAAGEPLPAGMRLAGGEGGAVTVQVARDGFAQVAGPLASPALVEGEAAGRRFACELPAAPAGDPLPDLGAVACR